MLAVEGTTIVIGIPTDFEVGYGTRLSQAHSEGLVDLDPIEIANLSQTTVNGPQLLTSDLTREDLQRGELIGVLRDKAPPKIVRATLPVRAVTRASYHVPDWHGARREGSLVAFDIPLEDHIGNELLVDDESREFEIQVYRFRRNAFGENAQTFERVPQSESANWLGWGHPWDMTFDVTKGVPITIRDADGAAGVEDVHFTPYDGYYWELFYGLGVLEMPGVDISGYVPDPRFLVSTAPTLPGTRPNAWEVTLRVPYDRIVIKDVLPVSEKAIVTFTGPPPSGSEPPCNGTGPEDGDLKIQFVNPAPHTGGAAVRTEGVWVIYELKDDVVDCIDTHLMSSDIQISASEVRSYDLDGEPMGLAASDFAVSGPDFN